MKGARLLLGLVAVSLATACGTTDLTGPTNGVPDAPHLDEGPGATGSGG
jgi:hypothetical protein